MAITRSLRDSEIQELETIRNYFLSLLDEENEEEKIEGIFKGVMLFKKRNSIHNKLGTLRSCKEDKENKDKFQIAKDKGAQFSEEAGKEITKAIIDFVIITSEASLKKLTQEEEFHSGINSVGTKLDYNEFR